MSFKLFFLNTFKGLKNTAKVETHQDTLRADYLQYRELLNSNDLNEYLGLEQLVNSDAFKKESGKLKRLKFEGSPEAKSLREFEKLEKNAKLRNLYLTESSADLQKFGQLDKSADIRTFIGLRDYVQSKKYHADKAAFKAQKGADESFETTEAHRKFETFQKLKSSEPILFWEEYPKRKEYKNYLKMVGSSVRSRFEELKAKVSSPEFQTRVEFLKDKKRWEKTEFYQQEKKYRELRSQNRFQIYEKYQKSDALSFFLNYDLVLEDNFDGTRLDDKRWKTISPLAESTLGRNFSKAGDLQAYTEGANVSVAGSSLKLVVKKEKTESMVWNFPIGFNPVSFDYSAGLLYSSEAFRAESGALEAKIRFQPNKKLVDLFYLTDDKGAFRLNLLEAGVVNRFSLSETGKDQHKALGGLAAGQFYIFGLEWSKNHICWKINGHKIYSIDHAVPEKALHVCISSVVVDAPGELPHFFEVDWVRLYKKK